MKHVHHTHTYIVTHTHIQSHTHAQSNTLTFDLCTHTHTKTLISSLLHIYTLNYKKISLMRA